MRSLYSKTLEDNGFEIQFIVNNNGEDYPIKPGDVYGALNYKKDDSTNTVEFYPNQNRVALIYNGYPEKAYTEIDTSANKNFQLSTLIFPGNEKFFIDENGYFYDQEDLITNGYLGFRKIGDMLPYNYQLKEEE